MLSICCGYFREQPGFNGANTLADCIAHSGALTKLCFVGIAARKPYMSTPFEGAWTVTHSDLCAAEFDIRVAIFKTIQYNITALC